MLAAASGRSYGRERHGPRYCPRPLFRASSARGVVGTSTTPQQSISCQGPSTRPRLVEPEVAGCRLAQSGEQTDAAQPTGCEGLDLEGNLVKAHSGPTTVRSGVHARPTLLPSPRHQTTPVRNLIPTRTANPRVKPNGERPPGVSGQGDLCGSPQIRMCPLRSRSRTQSSLICLSRRLCTARLQQGEIRLGRASILRSADLAAAARTSPHTCRRSLSVPGCCESARVCQGGACYASIMSR